MEKTVNNDIKKELVEYSKLMEEKGFVNALEGNISIYDRENKKLYITPSGKRKLFLKEDEVAVLDYDTEQQIDGICKASSEYRLHKAALDARKDCNAVIHCHCKYLTAYAMLGEDIKMDCCVTFAVFMKGAIKCIKYGKAGTYEIAKGIEDALKDRDVALLSNHGVVAIGKDISEAFKILEAMEETVEMYTIAKRLGTPLKLNDFDELITLRK